MSTLPQLLSAIDDTTNFQTLESFIDFAKDFLNFIGNDGLQADIVSRNEPHYHFFQYRENAGYAITRPINTDLFLTAEQFDSATQSFKYALRNIHNISGENELRKNINNYIYTCQQCIGCVLDTYSNQNKARKRNGLFFENLIKAVISFVGISATSVDEIISIADTDYTMKTDAMLSPYIKSFDNFLVNDLWRFLE